MTVLERFEHAFVRAMPADEPRLLPVRLAKAGSTALGVAGAGISLFTPGGVRVPLGASDDMAARAERLQFTYGAGPCIDAHLSREMIRVDARSMIRRWPGFARELMAVTPFRAIVAIPLSAGMTDVGTTDLYLVDPAQLDVLASDDLVRIADRVSERLASAHPADRADGDPAWLSGPSAIQRNGVFIAMGMVSVALDVPAAAALAAIRGRARRQHRTVDDISREIVGRTLVTTELVTDLEPT